MPDLSSNALAEALNRMRERMRAEFSLLEDRLETLQREFQELRAQMERSIANLDEQLETLGKAKSEDKVGQATPPLAPVAVVEAQPAPSEPQHLDEAAQKLHRDAVRYARLLVSEIELYHKEEVAQGRASKNLYVCLRHQIDRGYQAYQSRFGQTIVEERDYFHEEVVRTLAQNDLSLLGPDYSLPPE